MPSIQLYQTFLKVLIPSRVKNFLLFYLFYDNSFINIPGVKRCVEVRGFRGSDASSSPISRALHSASSSNPVTRRSSGSGRNFTRRSHFADSMATIRSLKIKTSTCKRIVKELHSYEKEVEREAAKTADMKEKGADFYDLKQQENVLAESRMMIPDCRNRLETALADLKGIVAELEESNEKEGPEIDEARSTIADVEKLFETAEA